LSYTHPKYAGTPIKLRLLSRFKEKWLAVPDSEKLPIAVLITIILSWFFSSLAAFLF
jgi:hypothetical protein